LLVLIFGPGRWALDAILGRFFGLEIESARTV